MAENTKSQKGQKKEKETHVIESHRPDPGRGRGDAKGRGRKESVSVPARKEPGLTMGVRKSGGVGRSKSAG